MDASSDDNSAAQSDGLRLAEDASRAASMPPPTDPSDYTTAMQTYQEAGQNAEISNWDGAGQLISIANQRVNSWKANQ